MVNLNRLGERIEMLFESMMKIFFLWLFGDVFYAVLPLITLLVVDGLTRVPLDHFWELKEWSFASIVIAGVLIRKFIRLKAVVQRMPGSFKLDSGVQMYVLLLICAVLVLGLVILAERGLFPPSVLAALSGAQVLVFALAAYGLLLTIAAEEQGESWVPSWLSNRSRQLFMRRATRELYDSLKPLHYVMGALKKGEEWSPGTFHSDVATDGDRLSVKQMLLILEEIEHSASQIRQRLVLLQERDAATGVL